ncbi:hypothetical protein L0V05_11815 [Tabrizicola sp. J26]|uniref:hypothetical protein n=1 Tax=Alitabrizicola rongguiensis TaxID=2909234 RepID=UPI001F252B2F|nr:hypothetical protein [Tabrizicola rongguiensis]MCF1709502.1 hypothetical protein [Tabrizicola rongguiensis]
MVDPVPVAFATMVRNEPIFLPIWINHYARLVPKSQLFILFDGGDQDIPPEAEGCQALVLPRGAIAAGWERRRWSMLADLAAMLLARFDVVVLHDVDELIVADPQITSDPLATLLTARERGVISPFGVEIIHRTDLETSSFDPARPVLDQRSHARVNASYSKPCILGVPVRWSPGGHYASHQTLDIDPALYLFHLRFMDRDLLLERQASRNTFMGEAPEDDEAPAGNGWSRDQTEIIDFLDSFVAKGKPQTTDFRFDWQRERIRSDWSFDAAEGIWRHGKLHNRKTYLIPERFRSAF